MRPRNSSDSFSKKTHEGNAIQEARGGQPEDTMRRGIVKGSASGRIGFREQITKKERGDQERGGRDPEAKVGRIRMEIQFYASEEEPREVRNSHGDLGNENSVVHRGEESPKDPENLEIHTRSLGSRYTPPIKRSSLVILDA